MANKFVVQDLRVRADSLALGNLAEASGSKVVALGYAAAARPAAVWNIAGLPVVRKDMGESDFVLAFGGAQCILLTRVASLKTVAEVEMALPAGTLFFPDEAGVIVTAATGVSGQPTLRFGFSGNPAGLLAPTATSGLGSAGDRQRFQNLLSAGGRGSLSAGVTSAASATLLNGRFYFKGVLVET